jgi:hypothetical protein
MPNQLEKMQLYKILWLIEQALFKEKPLKLANPFNDIESSLDILLVQEPPNPLQVQNFKMMSKVSFVVWKTF